jgi:hypothetical protein
MAANTSEPTMELINKELLIFKRYQVNVEDIKCPPQWWVCFLELVSMLDKS